MLMVIVIVSAVVSCYRIIQVHILLLKFGILKIWYIKCA